MSNIFKKLFFEDYWESYFRRVEGKDSSLWYKLIVPRRYWCADPFIVEDKGVYYVFCEMLDRKVSYGLIGCAVLSEHDIKVEPIADLKCHASYPDVFKFNDDWYMIPETSARKTIELYKAVEFPYKWEKVKTLTHSINAVDTTVFEANGELFVFIYEPNGMENSLSIGRLNMENFELEDITKAVQYHQKIGRPGGKIFKKDGKYIRPTQYGVDHYGSAIVLKEFSFIPDTLEYEEQDVKTINANSYLPSSISRCKTGFHTINKCGPYEIVDVYKEQFYWDRPFVLLFKRLKWFGYRFLPR